MITKHARQRMKERDITDDQVLEILTAGDLKQNGESKYWAYKKFHGRSDNLVCLAVKIEGQELVVITTLVNWMPHENHI